MIDSRLQQAINRGNDTVATLRCVRDRFEAELSDLRIIDVAEAAQAQREGRSDVGRSARTREILVASRRARAQRELLRDAEAALHQLILKTKQPKQKRTRRRNCGVPS